MESSSSSTFLTTTSLDQRNPSLVSRKPPKQKKKTSSTNKHIKVRYISNPMRVKTCASKFRELVQELTGQDAVDLQLEPVFPPSALSDHSPSLPPPENLDLRVLQQEPFDDQVTDYYEPLDGEDMFLPHMSAGFSGLFSNGFYNVNDFRRIDSV
ncbi:BnaC06g16070D [Brassica napus]|uniref:(rape) hypothetical protein n=1 Tax=Brassica napus TaxID=3708 RepID=A0A078H3T1_BRANA|nr:sigma factor binding protein 1, chloroplastic-like [Brassica napus]CAF2059024.1 unnamed protein product [Brassica napus]CDY32029.1 BnaC06g16070D [Brassica napus]